MTDDEVQRPRKKDKAGWEMVAPGIALRVHPNRIKGHLQVRVYAGQKRNGELTRAQFSFVGTRRQAFQAGIDKQRELQNRPVDPKKRTIAELVEENLKTKQTLAERGDLSPTTVHGHWKKYERYIKPYPIAELRVTKLDERDGPAHIVDWLNQLHATKKSNGKPLSRRTIAHAFHTLSNSLRFAIALGIIEKDPLRTVPKDLRPKAPPNGRPSLRSIGSTGQRAIMRAFEGTPDEAAVALALLGLRRGEILGLRRQGGDEDPQNGDVVLHGPRPIVRVRQVVIYARGGTQIKPYPKTETSRRDVVLPPWAVKALEDQKHRVNELRMRQRDKWQEHNLLFPSPGRLEDPITRRRTGDGVPGGPQHPNALYVRFKARLKKGLEGFDPARAGAIRLHDLRHTAVSVLINEAGMRAEDVQRVVGHADLKTTQAYRAVDEEPMNLAAAAFERILGGVS